MHSLLVLLPVLAAILVVAVLVLPKVLKDWKAKKLAQKRAELEDIQKRIPEVESSIVRLSINVRRMEDHAEDLGTPVWRARRDKRWDEVESDRTLLDRLVEREQQLKLELGIPLS
ncbi:MAG: hypothetical protein WAV25_00445 [Minisyncoccia bacterium]